MRNYDFTPLYRSAIGFDRLATMLDSALSTESQPSYPPYNVELIDENNYRITMAVAGFAEADIEIEFTQDNLRVSGKQGKEDAKRFLHQGIAARNFTRTFNLADHVKVVDAKLVNGLLHIDLVREVPDAMKPRRIEIKKGKSQILESKAA